MLRAELPVMTPATSPSWLRYCSVAEQHPVQGPKNLEIGHRAVPAAAPLPCAVSAQLYPCNPMQGISGSFSSVTM